MEVSIYINLSRDVCSVGLQVHQGFRLDCVAAVVDAEAGLEALQLPVARAQVCPASMNVRLGFTYKLNGCPFIVEHDRMVARHSLDG